MTRLSFFLTLSSLPWSPWFAGIPQRTGWRGEARSWILNDCRVLDKSQYPLMIERFVALAYARDAVLSDSPLAKN